MTNFDWSQFTPIDDTPTESPKTAGAIDWSQFTAFSDNEPVSTIDAQRQLYSTPNYAPVTNSPIDRNWYANHPEAVNSEVPTPAPQQVQQTLEADYQPPVDQRRDVGFWEAAKRYAEVGATKGVGILSGATSFLGYPITALDAAISGRAIPSVAETVSNAETPFEAEQKTYEVNPEKEKLTLSGQIGAGIGSAAVQLPLMALTGGASAAEQGAAALSEEVPTFANLAEQLGAKVFQSAKASAIPAAEEAQQTAKDIIDQGGSGTEAFNAALNSAGQMVAFNTLPMAAQGNVATRVATGAALGAGTTATQELMAGQSLDPSQIAAGAVTQAALAGMMGEAAHPKTVAERAATRVRDLTDEVISSDQVLRAQAAKGDSSAEGMVTADNMIKQAESGQTPTIPEPVDVTTNQKIAPITAESKAPDFSVEEMANGNRVLFRGDIEQIRTALESADIPPGMVKIEKGEPVGMYFPASYKERVSDVLLPPENIHENPSLAPQETQNVSRSPPTESESLRENAPPPYQVAENGRGITRDESRNDSLRDRVPPNIDSNGRNAEAPGLTKEQQIEAAYQQRALPTNRQIETTFSNKEKMDALGEHYQDYYDKLDNHVGKYPTKFHSEGEEVPNGLGIDEARQVLEKEWGKTAVSKMERNGLKLVPRESIVGETPELNDAQRYGVKGFTPADKGSAVVVHDNNTAAELPGTVIHEVWHANADQILPSSQKESLSKAVESLAARSPAIKEAIDRIPRNTPTGHRSDEILAYAMQHLYDQPIGQKIMGAVKIGLNRSGVPLHWINGHEAAIREIGIQNLRHFAQSENTRSYLGGNQGSFIHTTNPDDLTPRDTIPQDTQMMPSESSSLPESPVNQRSPNDILTTNNVGDIKSRDFSTPEQTRPTTEVPRVIDSRSEAQTPYSSEQMHSGVPLQTESTHIEPQERTTGIKNAVVNAERANRGMQEIHVEGKREFGQVWDTATERLNNDPGYGGELTKSIISNPRPLTAEETASLIQDRTRLNNSYESVLTRIDEAVKTKDSQAELEARYRLASIQEALDLNDVASRVAGYEQGLGLSVRRMMSKADYTLAKVMRRAEVLSGNKVPKDIQSKLTELTKRLEQQNKEIEALQAKQPATRTPRQKGQPREKTVVQNEFDKLKSELAKFGKKTPTAEPAVMYAREDIANLSKEEKTLIGKLARNRMEAGIESPEQLVKELHSIINNHIDISARDLRDLISGYGKEKSQTKDEVRQKINALKSEMRSLSKSEDISSGKIDPNAQKNKNRQTQLQKQIDELNRKLETNDFDISPKEKKNPKSYYDESTYKLEVARDRTKQEIEQRLETLRRKNRHWAEKSVDTALRIGRASILSGISVVEKLGAAAIARIGVTPIQEIAISALRQIPGIKQIANKASRYKHGFLWEAEKSAFKGTFSAETAKQMWNVLKTHKSDIDVLYGKDFNGPHDILEIPGQIHAMIKTPAKENEFHRSIVHEALSERERAIAKGMTSEEADAHMAKSSTQALIGAKAYAHAQNAILMGDNAAVNAYKTLTNALGNIGKEGSVGRVIGKGAKALLESELPIVKVPTNIVAEIGSYAGGGIKAAAQLALAKGIKSLTSEQADYIMSNLSKQTIGLALLAIGWYGYQSIGGLYHPGKKDPNAPDYGEAEVGDWKLGKWAFHTSMGEVVQIGATLRKIFEKEKSFGDAAFDVTKDVVGNLPFFDRPAKWGKALRNPTSLGQFFGEKVRSYIPPDIQRIAKANDTISMGGKEIPVTRKPKNFWQEVEMGIPGLRQNVPVRR